MDIRFNHTEPVDAAAETLFEVITDYAGYPRSTSSGQDDGGRQA